MEVQQTPLKTNSRLPDQNCENLIYRVKVFHEALFLTKAAIESLLLGGKNIDS